MRPPSLVTATDPTAESPRRFRHIRSEGAAGSELLDAPVVVARDVAELITAFIAKRGARVLRLHRTDAHGAAHLPDRAEARMFRLDDRAANGRLLIAERFPTV